MITLFEIGILEFMIIFVLYVTNIITILGFNPYMEFVTVNNFHFALPRLKTSSHRLEIESYRWTKPARKP